MTDRFILTPFFLDTFSPERGALFEEGWHLNRPDLPETSREQRMAALHEPIAAFVAETLSKGERPVSVAGDCCTTLGMVAGLQRAGLEPTLLWLDAHGDFNTPETTPSGFLGGMPLAMLTGRGDLTLAEAVGLRPLPDERVVLCDGRDLDPEEKEAVAASGLRHVRDVRELLGHPWLEGPLYVHFDADIVNPSDAPAMSYRAEGGPSAAELAAVFDALARRGQIVAISMTTWTPELDEGGRSREVCLGLLRCLIGD
jgi:arginase